MQEGCEDQVQEGYMGAPRNEMQLDTRERLNGGCMKGGLGSTRSMGYSKMQLAKISSSSAKTPSSPSC